MQRTFSSSKCPLPCLRTEPISISRYPLSAPLFYTPSVSVILSPCDLFFLLCPFPGNTLREVHSISCMNSDRENDPTGRSCESLLLFGRDCIQTPREQEIHAKFQELHLRCAGDLGGESIKKWTMAERDLRTNGGIVCNQSNIEIVYLKSVNMSAGERGKKRVGEKGNHQKCPDETSILMDCSYCRISPLLSSSPSFESLRPPPYT